MSEKKSPSAKILFLVFFFLGLGGMFAYRMSSNLSSEQTTQTPSASPSAIVEAGQIEGSLAPVFELKNLKGQPVKLDAYKGKVVFLNFWATWCDPCKEEMPSMERLYQQLKGQPFEILAVSLDQEPSKDVPLFLSKTKMQISFPVLADLEQKVSKNLYKTTGVPESFIIGPDGKVLKHAIGAYEWDSPEIIKYFEAQLKAASAG